MTVHLDPFDPQAACPKCGTEEVGATWHAGAVLAPRSACWDVQLHEAVIGEHICRHCSRCSYGWCEAVNAGPAPSGRASLSFMAWAACYLDTHPWGADIARGLEYVWVHIPAAHIRRMLEDAYRAGAGGQPAGESHHGGGVTPMAIRKTGSATGEVLGTEGTLSKTASGSSQWSEEDEDGLAEENQADSD